MKLSRISSITCAFFALAGFQAAGAATILFNFGTTVDNSATGVAAGPGHSVGGYTGTNWNLVTADKLTGNVDSAGNPIGVSIDLGKEVGSTNVLNFSLGTFSTSALGTNQSTGIYAGNAKSATFNAPGENAIGAKIGGLSPGSYEVFVVSKNTNYSGTEPYDIRYGAMTSTATSQDYSAFSTATISNAKSVEDDMINTTTWVQGQNYQKFTVTLAAGQDLFIASDQAGRGFFNTIEINAIPEPSVALLGIAGLAGMALRRRR